MGWIIIRNWDRHQHYGDREPPWIKLYVRLLHDDEFQKLSPGDRSALVGLWMIYAITRRRVRDDTAVISRSIGQRVTKATLERLNHAGFIEVSASKPLAQEVEVDKESPKSPYKQRRELPPAAPNGSELDANARRIIRLIANGAIGTLELENELRESQVAGDLADDLRAQLKQQLGQT